MPGSVTSVFSEPADFEAALREEGGVGLLVTRRGEFRARLTQVALHRLRLSATEEQLPRIVLVAVPADMILVSLPMGDRPAPIWAGIGMRAGEFLTIGPGESVHARTGGPSRWGAIWCPVEVLARYGRALIGATFAVPSVILCWLPPPAVEKDLRQLHAAAIRVAETRPEVLVGSEAAHGLEQQLIDVLVECLSAGSADKGTPAARRHRDIAVRFEGLLQTQPERNFRIAEICAALGVSDWILRRCCDEQLGMNATSYLRLHRMQQVHRALRNGNRDTASVSEIARRYGFRDPGRFPARYRALYGELPAATLRRASRQGVAELTLGRPRIRFP
jgi:AraC family ethanolamine operon transcriptional activator